MDGATLRYVEEALSAFNARCFLATSVMIGVASESAFGHLAQAFIDGRPNDSTQLRKLLTNPGSSHYKRFEEFRKRVEPMRSTLPTGLADTGQAIDEDTAFTHLQVAARYLVKMTELTEHLKPLPF